MSHLESASFYVRAIACRRGRYKNEGGEDGRGVGLCNRDSYDDRVINGTRVLRNPLGYPRERPGREDMVTDLD
jgi:hypothetical protein